MILLHQSPASSAELLPLMRELATNHTVLTPDTPGNGLSPPLPMAHPSIDDFADNVIAFMDELRLPRAAVYGFHTGAAIAMSLSHRHAARITLAVANGYTQMQPAERADILQHYLPPLRIEWNGAHLLWAWSRIRDQYIFFPWYARVPEARLISGMPGTRQLHEGVMDLLRAGDGYGQSYRAAFEYDRAAVVGELQAPTVLLTAQTDALYRYLELMPPPSAAVTVRRPADHIETRQILRDALAEKASGASTPLPQSTRGLQKQLWRDYLQTPQGSLFALRSHEGQGRPLVLCHDSSGSALGLEPVMERMVGRRPLLAVDLPGNGESDGPQGEPISVAARAAALDAALSAAGYTDVDLLAFGDGACVAAELAEQRPQLIHALQLTDQVPRRIGQSIELDDYGAHLLRVWNIVRDQRLYAPWQLRKRENVRVPDAQELLPARIHARTLDVLKCLDALPQIEAAHASFPLAQTLARLAHKRVPTSMT